MVLKWIIGDFMSIYYDITNKIIINEVRELEDGQIVDAISKIKGDVNIVISRRSELGNVVEIVNPILTQAEQLQVKTILDSLVDRRKVKIKKIKTPDGKYALKYI